MLGYYSIIPEKNIFVDKIFKWIIDIFVVIMIALFFLTFMGEKHTIAGNSMSPIVKNNETVLIDKFSYKRSDPKRFDVIVFKSDDLEEELYYTRRIIALPGEAVRIKNGVIYINGEKLLFNLDKELIVNAGLAAKEITLSYNEYFVIGDNWNSSEDSRFESMGNISRENIIGKAWIIISPFARIDLIK